MGFTADGIEFLISADIHDNIFTLLKDEEILIHIKKNLKRIPYLQMMASYSHSLTGKYEVASYTLFTEIKHIIEGMYLKEKTFQKKINTTIKKYKGEIIEDKTTIILTLIVQGYMDELGYL